MSARLLTLAVLVLGSMDRVSTAAASQESIGLFFDDDCANCSTTMLPGEQRILEIRAIRGGATEGYDLAGAHFAVDGLPAGWTAECFSSNPGTYFSMGNPFEDGGSVFFSCAPGQCVPLYRCTITATTAATARLQVIGHSFPQGCPSGAPCIAYCAPAPTAVRATGGQALINNGPCTVGVQPAPWSLVKRLYE